MEHNGHHDMGAFNLITSILCSIVAWISLKDAQTIMAMCASGIAMISGGFAIKYYWKSIKKMNDKI